MHYFTHAWINRLFFLLEFPHSEIPGSKLICSSPRLFATCYVLRRLLVPRHSPYALSSLTYNQFKIILRHYGYSFLALLYSFEYSSLPLLILIKLKFAFCKNILQLLYIFQCAILTLHLKVKLLNFELDSKFVVELRRVELLTSCLQGRRSSQLSYSPINHNVLLN